MIKRIVLTGGPGVGKSATLEALQAIGMNIATDSARDVIRERLELGFSPRPAPAEFANEVLARDIAAYKNVGNGDEAAPIFFERGVVDSVASVWARKSVSTMEMNELILKHPYHQPVFVFPPWAEIYKTDAERDQTYTESVRTYGRIVAWYLKNGYQLCEVPKGPVEDRAGFILEESGIT